jgi:hypothetical protein
LFPAGDFGNTAAIASCPPIAADRIAEIVYAIPPHQLCFVGQPDPSCSRRAGSKRRASGGSYSRDRAPSPSCEQRLGSRCCEQRLGSRCGVRDGSPTASGRPSMCPLDAERAADSRQKITLYIETLRCRTTHDIWLGVFDRTARGTRSSVHRVLNLTKERALGYFDTRSALS